VVQVLPCVESVEVKEPSEYLDFAWDSWEPDFFRVRIVAGVVKREVGLFGGERLVLEHSPAILPLIKVDYLQEEEKGG
jgi:hypothetical protein